MISKTQTPIQVYSDAFIRLVERGDPIVLGVEANTALPLLVVLLCTSSVLAVALGTVGQ